jgi:hypothetical protein
MEFQRFLGHIGGQGVVGIGQIGQREGHGVMSELMGDVGLTGTLIEGSIGLKHRNLTKAGRFFGNDAARPAYDGDLA